MQKKHWIVILFWSWIVSLSAQIQWTDHLGGRVGVTLQFGKPVNRIGLVANAFYVYDFAQLNLEWRGHYNFQNYGPPLKGWEMQTTTGLTIGYGNEASEEIPFAFPIFHQTKRRYALTYAIHFYHDKIGTSQRSGSLVFQFDRIHLVVENDVFGSFKGEDQFRTGAFSIFYHQEDWLFELKSVMWTGATRGEAVRNHSNENYPCRWGYRDICHAKHGRFSHGVLAAQVHRVFDYGQVAQIGLGIDSERVRNFLQNKIMHDLYFVPKAWVKAENRHLPMLDKEGLPYLFQEGQKLKPASWYLNFGLNGERFY